MREGGSKMNRSLGLILAMSIILAGCMGSVEEDVFYGEDINPPVPVTDFILTDENGDYFLSLIHI